MLFGSKVNRLSASGKRALSKYAVGTAEPELAFDFIDNKYVTSNSTTPIASAVTHSRAGNATMTDGYGPELVTNGTFASDSDWTKGTGWSIADGKSSRTNTGATSGLSQTITLTADVVYEVSYFLQIDSGNIATQFIGGTNVAATAHTTSGYKTDYIKANTGNTQIRLWASTTFEGSIDNVSVREMPVIKWAPHNLLTYSEQFDNAAWLRTDCTIDPNATTAPDGTATADELDFVGTNDLCRQISAHVPKVGETYTIACWLKAGTASSIDLVVLFSGGGLGSTTKVCSLTNEWQLFTVSKTVPSGTPDNVRIRLQSNGAGTVYAWGAHAYRSDLGGMVDNPDRGDSYVPTTSAAAYLPRVGHHVYNGDAWVNEGVLAESEARTNLTAESLPNSTWTANDSTLTENQAVSPDGTENASKVAETATTANHYIYYGAVNISYVSGTTYTQSAVLKKGTSSLVQLVGTSVAFGTTVYANFDLSDGTVGDVGSGVSSTTVEDLGNGWYRCSMTADATITATGNNDLIMSITSKTSVRTEIFAGSTSNYFYVYHAQTEAASTPSSLVPTSGSTVTRAAETFTIPSANLPWPTPEYIGSELVTNGTFDTDLSGWTAGSSWSWVSGKAYDGDTQSGTPAELKQSISVTSGKVYAISFDVSGLSGGNPTASWAGSTLVQITADGSYEEYVVATGSSHTLQFIGANAIYYIDNVSVREINPLSVSIAMDGRMTYADDGDTGSSRFYQIQDGQHYLRAYLDTSSTKTGLVRFEQKDGTTYDSVDSSGTLYSPDILVPFNIASRHGSTFINGAIDGVALTANTTPTALPDLSATDLDLAYDYMGTIGTFRVWKRDLGDTGIVEATNPSLEPSLSLTFEGTGEGSFVVRDWSE